VIRIESLAEYFQEALAEALSRTHAEVTFEAQAYVVGMLNEFSRTENAFAGADRGEQQAYAILLSRALDSAPQEALRIYKHVGDSMLYHLGFFKEFANHRTVNESYYFSLGEQAYAQASSISHSSGRIYNELSDRFIELVLVCNEMSAHGDRNKPAGAMPIQRLFILIDRYQKTKNPQIGEVLRRQGVNLPPEPKKT
jgi:hypothetical protein